ncbi:MAG TPA: hypothetical protein VHM65_07320, partial [Candidatus Lustribacter sp.]|nr:hypothetical protein [Candidatus Lustribacter sp.]
DVARLRRGGAVMTTDPELPEEADDYRRKARAFRSELDALPAAERQRAFVDSGYANPHFATPFGRGAGPVEQLVCDTELAGLQGPQLGIGSWIVPTLIQHGTPEQLDRWIWPTLPGSCASVSCSANPRPDPMRRPSARPHGAPTVAGSSRARRSGPLTR